MVLNRAASRVNNARFFWHICRIRYVKDKPIPAIFLQCEGCQKSSNLIRDHFKTCVLLKIPKIWIKIRFRISSNKLYHILYRFTTTKNLIFIAKIFACLEIAYKFISFVVVQVFASFCNLHVFLKNCNLQFWQSKVFAIL